MDPSPLSLRVDSDENEDAPSPQRFLVCSTPKVAEPSGGYFDSEGKSDALMRNMLAGIDKDGNGEITSDELLAFVRDSVQIQLALDDSKMKKKTMQRSFSIFACCALVGLLLLSATVLANVLVTDLVVRRYKDTEVSGITLVNMDGTAVQCDNPDVTTTEEGSLMTRNGASVSTSSADFSTASSPKVSSSKKLLSFQGSASSVLSVSNAVAGTGSAFLLGSGASQDGRRRLSAGGRRRRLDNTKSEVEIAAQAFFEQRCGLFQTYFMSDVVNDYMSYGGDWYSMYTVPSSTASSLIATYSALSGYEDARGDDLMAFHEFGRFVSEDIRQSHIMTFTFNGEEYTLEAVQRQVWNELLPFDGLDTVERAAAIAAMCESDETEIFTDDQDACVAFYDKLVDFLDETFAYGSNSERLKVSIMMFSVPRSTILFTEWQEDYIPMLIITCTDSADDDWTQGKSRMYARVDQITEFKDSFSNQRSSGRQLEEEVYTSASNLGGFARNCTYDSDCTGYAELGVGNGTTACHPAGFCTIPCDSFKADDTCENVKIRLDNGFVGSLYCSSSDYCECACCSASARNSSRRLQDQASPGSAGGITRGDGSTDCECFPAEASVSLESGGSKTMRELQLGDKVLTSSGTFEPIYFFGHADAELVIATYVKVALGRGSTITLSQDHFAVVYQAGVAKAVYAKHVQIGDTMKYWDGAQFQFDQVSAVRIVVDQGAFNPYTLGGDIVVDGVVASCHSSWVLDKFTPSSLSSYLPAMYQRFFFLARVAYGALGPTGMQAAFGVGNTGFTASIASQTASLVGVTLACLAPVITLTAALLGPALPSFA